MSPSLMPPACPSPSSVHVARARAVHQLLDEPRVLDDPYAIGVLGTHAAASLLSDPHAHNDVPSRSMRAGIVARSRFAEDRLMRALCDGTRQVAIVGAGLDTWALRAATTLPDVRVFEIDQPAMVEWKQRLHAGHRWEWMSARQQVPADLREVSVPDALEQAGADPGEPVAVSMLGVLVYLEPERVEQTLASLGRLAPGSTLTLDYRLDADLLSPVEQMMMQATADMMAAGGEPWRSSSQPARMRRLLAEAGFTVEEDLAPADLNHRYFDRRRDGLQIAGGGFRHLSAIRPSSATAA